MDTSITAETVYTTRTTTREQWHAVICTCANCEKIGGGEKLRLATGTEVCTGTIRVFEMRHGPLPDHWLPTTPCADPWVLPERYA